MKGSKKLVMNEGDVVLIRAMECTNKTYDQWEVVYKRGVITQKDILSSSNKNLFTVRLPNGQSEYVWDDHILECPEGLKA